MRDFIIVFVLAFTSCKNNSENSKLIYFNNSEINIPSYLTLESSSSCKNEINLKDAKENIVIKLKLCDYGLKKGRQSYQQLKKFFQDECNVLKEEIPESILVDKKSLNNKNYYSFTHEFKIGEKYHSNNYIAFEKYYITIRFQSKLKEKIPELRQIVEKIKKKDLTNYIDRNEDKKNCYYCTSPLFW
ncbi:MAG: hypothetical protein AB8B78_02695 [Polaribacter sp.]